MVSWLEGGLWRSVEVPWPGWNRYLYSGDVLLRERYAS